MYDDEIARFKKIHGYEPDLEHPKGFNEKVVFKKLFDRNPLLPITADKYRVRDFIRSRIGWQAEKHLIPLLWVGENPEEIPFWAFDKNYIAKPNNGAGRWVIKERHGGILSNPTDKYTVDRRGIFYDIPNNEIIRYCKDWFKTVHGAEWHEWAYGPIKPLIVVEELLYNKGDIPHSYKFSMFGGKCRMIYVLNRDDIEITHYSPEWEMLEVKRKGHPKGPEQPRPKHLDQMIKYAEKLSIGFDFVRVDFFLVGDHFYFGEMTHYPGSGHGVWEPAEYDFELGKWWK